MNKKTTKQKAYQCPPIYENWKYYIDKKPSQGIYEYPLFSDAIITGENATDYGPYQFLNPVPPRRKAGDVQAVLILRVKMYFEFKIPEMNKTDTGYYHGGLFTDEIASLVSLALGARIKAGGMVRWFGLNKDPLGKPVAWESRPIPIVLIENNRLKIPNAVGEHNIKNLQPLSLLPNLLATDVIALIRSARLYQDALWIAESEPSLAWVMLVSAIESAANHWNQSRDTPLQRLKFARPKLLKLLKDTRIKNLPEQIANEIADTVGSTKKFVYFISHYLPPAPKPRPNIFAQHPWNTEEIQKTLKLIYKYRSKALHGGISFPAPMCEPPYYQKDWDAPAEIPMGLAANSKGGTWTIKDTPMLLHVFEYIVRNVLLEWWKTLKKNKS